MSGMMSEERKVVETLSKEWAEQYQAEHRRGLSRANHLVEDSQSGLEFFLENGFARAGGEQAGYGNVAVKALEESTKAHGGYDELLQSDNAPEVVWSNFVQTCSNRKIGVNKKVNEGVVKGL